MKVCMHIILAKPLHRAYNERKHGAETLPVKRTAAKSKNGIKP